MLFIHPLVNIWVVSTFGLLKIRQLQTWLNKYFSENLLLILGVPRHVPAKSPGNFTFSFVGPVTLLSSQLHHFTFSTAIHRISKFSTFSLTFAISFHHPSFPPSLSLYLSLPPFPFLTSSPPFLVAVMPKSMKSDI